jgi:branched-chain amino acid transport system permease protein
VRAQSFRPLMAIAAIAITLLLPQLAPTNYIVNAMITTMSWIIFALSFDLSAGHVGTVSLGHPVFYGVGAYVTALLAPKLGLDFFGAALLSAASMGLLAVIAGFAFFRISEVSFAIGTLGALIIAQLVANNAYDITGGPMCVQGIARPVIQLPGQAPQLISEPTQYYYLLVPLLLVTALLYWRLTHSRIGRAFNAVRQDEVRALAMGIYPKRYKLLAFAVGAALIGALGSFQAQYVTVVCPSELAITYTLNLLIIVFVGGSGSMAGVILGALLFGILPRFLETSIGVSPAQQQLIYGVILLLVIRFLPEGLISLLDRLPRLNRNESEVSRAS